MSKSLRSYPLDMRESVVRRRLAQAEHGLGYCAALDYMKCKKAQSKSHDKKAEAQE